MPGLDGLATTRRLVESGVQGHIVILTTFDTDGYVLGAIEAGAAGFLLKNTPPDRLVEAVRTVHGGDSVISPGPTRRLLTAVRSGTAVTAGTTSTSGATRRPRTVAGDPGAAGTRASEPEALRVTEDLTGREREILALIAAGLTNGEICDRLWLSMPTVKTHVSHLLAKTGCRDRVQLVLLALRTGVVTLDQVLAAPV